MLPSSWRDDGEPSALRSALYRTRSYTALQRKLARNVVRLRNAHGWSQEEAAHHTKKATRPFQRLEAGDTNASLVTIARLVDGFGVEAADLFR